MIKDVLLIAVVTCVGCGAPQGSGAIEEGCEIRFEGQCYSSTTDACAAASCPPERCTILRSYPGQVDCAPEPEATIESPPSPAGAVEEQTLIGRWVGDPSCVADMQGMEGADAATSEAVAAQVATNTFVFTDSSLVHRIGTAGGSPEPYTVIAHEGATWTLEMAGPTGAPQRTDIVIDGDQMRMTREGALVICLRRQP